MNQSIQQSLDWSKRRGVNSLVHKRVPSSTPKHCINSRARIGDKPAANCNPSIFVLFHKGDPPNPVEFSALLQFLRSEAKQGMTQGREERKIAAYKLQIYKMRSSFIVVENRSQACISHAVHGDGACPWVDGLPAGAMVTMASCCNTATTFSS